MPYCVTSLRLPNGANNPPFCADESFKALQLRLPFLCLYICVPQALFESGIILPALRKFGLVLGVLLSCGFELELGSLKLDQLGLVVAFRRHTKV